MALFNDGEMLMFSRLREDIHSVYARDPAAHLEKLKSVSEKITQLGAALPRPVPGDFAHYLQRASYEKALAWIEANQRS